MNLTFTKLIFVPSFKMSANFHDFYSLPPSPWQFFTTIEQQIRPIFDPSHLKMVPKWEKNEDYRNRSYWLTNATIFFVKLTKVFDFGMSERFSTNLICFLVLFGQWPYFKSVNIWIAAAICKGKTLLGVFNKLLNTKSFLTMPSNVLLLCLKQTFEGIIWIFIWFEGD